MHLIAPHKSSWRQRVPRIKLSFYALHQLARRTKITPGIKLVPNLVRRTLNNQTAAETFGLLPQAFERAHGFAMIHRSASNCAEPAVTEAGMPAESRVRGVILLQLSHALQKNRQIGGSQGHTPFQFISRLEGHGT